MKIPKDKIKKWIKELRSDKWAQTGEALENGRGHCCLGVACEVFSPGYMRDKNGYLAGGLPERVAGAEVWLTQINQDFANRTDDATLVSNISLSDLNDSGYSFDEIADCLQIVYLEGGL